MIKKLPVNLKVNITTDCWHFYRLCIILSDDKYTPWYIERFIKISFNETSFLSYYYSSEEWGVVDLYSEVLRFQEIREYDNITNRIAASINNNGYVLIELDNFYVKQSIHYMQRHELHETLITGYDDIKKEFYYISWMESRWVEQALSFEDLEASFKSVINIINSDIEQYTWIKTLNLPITSIYLNNNFNREPNMFRVYDSININLQGNTKDVTKGSGKEFLSDGLSIYKGYYTKLKNKILNDETFDNYLVVMGIKRLLENKQGLLFRIEYLSNNGFIENDTNTIRLLKELIDKIEKFLGLMIKLTMKYNKDYLERACEYLRKAESIDKEVHLRIKNQIFNILSF